MGWQGLNFIKKHHGAGDVVQLAAISGLVTEQTLEELDARCNDERRSPVFRSQTCAAQAFLLCVGIRIAWRDRTMVLQNVIGAKLVSKSSRNTCAVCSMMLV